MGMLCGIEFTAPRQLALRIAFESFRRIHPAHVRTGAGDAAVPRPRILTQICGNNFLVLKVAPPLVVSGGAARTNSLSAVRDVVDLAHTSTVVLERGAGPGPPRRPTIRCPVYWMHRTSSSSAAGRPGSPPPSPRGCRGFDVSWPTAPRPADR